MKIELNKNKMVAFIVLIGFIALLVLGSFFYIFRSSIDDCYSSMYETASMVNTRVVSSINTYSGTLTNIALLIASFDDAKQPDVASIVNNVRIHRINSPLRLFLEDGYAVTENGVYENVSNLVNYKDICADGPYISLIHKDPFNQNKDIVEYFCPVIKDGKTIGMLAAIMDVHAMEEFVKESSKYSKAFVIVIDKRNNKILINTGDEKIHYLNEISSERIKRGPSMEEFNALIQKNIPAQLIIKSINGKNYNLLYSSHSIVDDWGVLIYMDSKVAFKSVILIRNIMLFLFIALLISFSLYVIWVFNLTKIQMSEQSKEYSEIAIALSRSFDGIYYVNLDDNSYLEFTSQGDYANLPIDTNGKNFFADSFNNLRKVTYENDVRLLTDFIKKENLLAELIHGDFTSPPYRLVIDGKPVYYRLKVIMPKTEADHVIVAAENIDSEMTRSINQQKRLEEALEKAETANKAKTVFLNNMSHDIRTPMNAIIGFTQLASKIEENPQVTKDYLQKVDIASKHLLSLINDVLDMSRIESGKVVITEQPENIKQLISYLEDIVIADIKAKNHKLVVDTSKIADEYVLCDKLRLNQILLNVVSNAIKYTPENGKISVVVEEKQEDFLGYNTYEISIKDNGIGMNKKFLKTIFTPFTREKSSTISGVQGTGLGMCITKNLIDMMNGTIEIESTPGQGTEVIIKLPFKVTQSPDKDKSLEEKRSQINLVGMKILIVDDNDFNREIAHIILEQENIEVKEAFNGQEAFDIISNSKPGDFDLVLMDVQMPVMDGYTATKAIRKLENKELANIPIIAMTANAFFEDRKNALAAGMNEHLTKPVDIDKLVETLSTFWKK